MTYESFQKSRKAQDLPDYDRRQQAAIIAQKLSAAYSKLARQLLGIEE